MQRFLCVVVRSLSDIMIQALLKGQVVAGQASIDKQTKLSKPEESTSQSTLSVVLVLSGISNSVNNSSNRPDDTESRAEQRVTEATDKQCCEGHVVVLEVVTVGALCLQSEGARV